MEGEFWFRFRFVELGPLRRSRPYSSLEVLRRTPIPFRFPFPVFSSGFFKGGPLRRE